MTRTVPDTFAAADLALKFADGNELLPAARAEARVLGKCLVLDDDGRDAGGCVLRHDVSNVHRVAKPGVEIGDHRRILHLADRAHHLQMRTHRQDIGVGHRVGRRQFETATPNGIEARIRGELCGERIMRRHGQRWAMHVDLGA